mgnify:CR=1 FL=1
MRTPKHDSSSTYFALKSLKAAQTPSRWNPSVATVSVSSTAAVRQTVGPRLPWVIAAACQTVTGACLAAAGEVAAGSCTEVMVGGSSSVPGECSEIERCRCYEALV